MGEMAEELLELLDLQEQDTGVFLGAPAPDGQTRVFGGQVVSQALAAACFSVDGWGCHSLHGYFVRPGKVGRPTQFEVMALHNARRLATRQVVAVQRDEVNFHMVASFQADAPQGPEYAPPMPDVPRPEDLPSQEEQRARALDNAPEAAKAYMDRRLPVQMSFVDEVDWFNPKPGEPRRRVWIRTRGKLPDYPNLHRCALAFASDFNAIDSCMIATGSSYFNPAYQVASLDHAVWFHRDFRMDDWLLFSWEGASVAHGRGLSRGSVFDMDGQLVASMSQESIIHKRED